MALGGKEIAVVLKLVTDQFNKNLKKSGDNTASFAQRVGKMKIALVAVGAAIGAIVKITANYGDQLRKTSQELGIGVEQLSGIQFAASLAGVETNKFTAAIGLLAKNSAQAAIGTGEAKIAFDAMGFSVTDATGKMKGTPQLLSELADRFSKMKDSGQKTALAMQIFGESGRKLLPFLNEGSDGIARLEKEAAALGLTMSEEDAKAAEEFNNQLVKLKGVLTGLIVQMGTEFLPILTSLVDGFVSLMKVVGGVKAFAKGLVIAWLEFEEALSTVTVRVINMGKAFGRVFGFFKQGAGGMIADLKAIDAEAANTIKTLREAFEARKLEAGGGVQGGFKIKGVLGGPGTGGGGKQTEDAPGLIDPRVGKEQERLGREIVKAATKMRLDNLKDVIAKIETELILLKRAGAEKAEIDKKTMELIFAQRDLDLEDVKLTEAGKVLIREKANQKVIDLSKKTAKEIKDGMSEAAQGAASIFGEKFFDFMEGRVVTLSGIMEDFGNLAKRIASRAVENFAVQALSSGGGGGGGFNFGSLFGAAAAGAAAQGGVYPKFAGGGITGATSQLVEVGEGGKKEGIVPLPDGRNIPVKLAGGQPSGETRIELTIVNEIQGQKGNAGFNKRQIADVRNIIQADALNGGTVRKSLRKATGRV